MSFVKWIRESAGDLAVTATAMGENGGRKAEIGRHL
jgi:hypothetical protein